jgi:hypothetical protein
MKHTLNNRSNKLSKAQRIVMLLNEHPKTSIKKIAKLAKATPAYVYKQKQLLALEHGVQPVTAPVEKMQPKAAPAKQISDGSTARYYELPGGASELQHLISYKDMNSQLGEIFRETYRYGEASHSDRLRGIRKIKFYAFAEEERLLNL